MCTVASQGRRLRKAPFRSACRAPVWLHSGIVDVRPRSKIDPQPVHFPALDCSLPTIGMLFSAWQATTQALHPMHAVMSIDHAPLEALVFELAI